MLSSLTLLIPTFNNRHHYLRRILDYYQEASAGFPILICDSSAQAFHGAADAGEHVRYLHFPGARYCEKMDLGMREVHTDYAVLCADDDFIAPAGLQSCIDFLDQNAAYASTQGHLVGFAVPGKIRPVPWMFHTAGLDINDASPSQRILHFFKHHIYLHYSVHRRRNLADTFSISQDFTDVFAGGSVEYLLDIVALLHGKHKVLPVFYAAQELAAQSGRNTVIGLTDLRKQVEYQEEYVRLTDRLSALLAATEPMHPDKALAFVEDFFTNHPKFQIRELVSSAVANPLSGPRLRFLKNAVDRMKYAHALKRFYSQSVYFLQNRITALKASDLKRKQLGKARRMAGFPYRDKSAGNEWNKISEVIARHAAPPAD